jgi:hypothetical protein
MTRRGAALISAVLALLCVAALLTATALTGREDYLISSSATEAQVAFAAAEHGVWTGVAVIDSADAARPLGSTRTVSIRHGSGMSTAVTVTRLSSDLFFVIAEAFSVRNGGRRGSRRIGVFARARADSAGRVSAAPLAQRAWVELP